MISAKRVFAVFLRQLYLFRSSRTRLLPIFLWVSVDMFLWGFMTRYLDRITDHAQHFVPQLLGAILLWNFFNRVMFGVAMAFFEDVWSKNFLNFFSTPLSVTEYVSGLVLSSICTSAVGLMVMLVIASVFFGFSFFVYGLMIFPFILILFLFGIALGVFGCGIVLRFGPSAEWIIWPLPFVISPFCAVYYPLSTLPSWMQIIGNMLPPTHVFEAIRGLLSGQQYSWGLLMWSVLLDFFFVGAAGWFFSYMYQKAIDTGLIARYSAESVG